MRGGPEKLHADHSQKRPFLGEAGGVQAEGGLRGLSLGHPGQLQGGRRQALPAVYAAAVKPAAPDIGPPCHSRVTEGGQGGLSLLKTSSRQWPRSGDRDVCSTDTAVTAMREEIHPAPATTDRVPHLDASSLGERGAQQQPDRGQGRGEGPGAAAPTRAQGQHRAQEDTWMGTGSR